jgi:radical SAM enzyme (TIGR01210 family)
MCDLWRHTTVTDTPRGAIPRQLADARRAVERAAAPGHEWPRVFKLYNAGSFFDPRAVPDSEYAEIAAGLGGLSRVIVESHPALVDRGLNRFIEALRTQAAAEGPCAPPVLEVAMGLETVHPSALAALHKGISIESFTRAAAAVRHRKADLRVFLLIAPPFVPADAQDDWLIRSVDTAVSCEATAISLIPTRPGNGALEALAAAGVFVPPRLDAIERVFSLALERSRPRSVRVFVDLWDLERFADCKACLPARRARLDAMNLQQVSLPAVACADCEHGPDA